MAITIETPFWVVRFLDLMFLGYVFFIVRGFIRDVREGGTNRDTK